MSAIILSDGVTTIALPGGLDWSDRRAWSPVKQSKTFGLTGAPIVQAAAVLAGRPITLEGGNGRAWIATSICDQLQGWANIPGQLLVLTIDGTAYPVIWRHDEPPAFFAVPVWGRASPPAEWPQIVTLKFATRIA